MNRDFMGVILGVGQADPQGQFKQIYEDVRDGNFSDISNYGLEKVSLNESDDVQIKTVKEKYGSGVSLVLGDKEYRFVSDQMKADELEYKIISLSESEELSQWLNENTVCYFEQSLDEANGSTSDNLTLKEFVELELGREVEEHDGWWEKEVEKQVKRWFKFWSIRLKTILGKYKFKNMKLDVQGDIIQVKADANPELSIIIDILPDDDQVDVHVSIYNPKTDDYDEFDVESVKGASCKNVLDLVSKYCKDNQKKWLVAINEATQTSDVATKVDQEVSKNPVEGKSYEFEDGVFKVESVKDDEVYLIDSDGEYYSMKIDDFKKEVINSLDEKDSKLEGFIVGLFKELEGDIKGAGLNYGPNNYFFDKNQNTWSIAATDPDRGLNLVIEIEDEKAWIVILGKDAGNSDVEDVAVERGTGVTVSKIKSAVKKALGKADKIDEADQSKPVSVKSVVTKLFKSSDGWGYEDDGESGGVVANDKTDLIINVKDGNYELFSTTEDDLEVLTGEVGSAKFSKDLQKFHKELTKRTK